VAVARARSHQSVDWTAYFESIQKECPWSLAAWRSNKIDIVEYSGTKFPIGDFAARMYVLSAPDATVVAIAQGFDYSDSECEWLYSYPGYGEFATPVSVLIQQPRKILNELRQKLTAY
jgi:hypothetical protein